ncbi:MAG: FHA domain-containing protein [Planctomycetota bacterium]
MPSLTIRENGVESRFQIDSDEVKVGRAAHNDVALADGKASKEHCRIVREGEGWKLIDLESHNGTRVNGDYANKAWLHHEDTIRIGTTELRFGLEGKARARAAAPAAAVSTAGSAAGSAAGSSGAAAPPPPPREYDYDDDASPPSRRYNRKSSSDQMVIYGGAVLGVVLIVILVLNVMSGLREDDHNEQVRNNAEKYVENGQYEEAIAYLMENGDASGTGYQLVLNRINELEKRMPAMKKSVRERASLQLLSRMSRKIANYDRGGSASPDEILKMMNQLKTEYAGTENEERAAQTFPEWYAGNVPEPAVDRRNPMRKLKRDWEEVCAQADEYRKKENFREARETLERFVRVRETTLDEFDLQWLRGQLRNRVGNIERLASTYYSSTERRARDLIKKKRWGQATDLYRKVIANYGIDKYVRKAKEAIAEIEELKRKDEAQGSGQK